MNNALHRGWLFPEVSSLFVQYRSLPALRTRVFSGAKKSGAKGFFKGMGKGLVGVIARPMSGVVDFASSTLEGIKG